MSSVKALDVLENISVVVNQPNQPHWKPALHHSRLFQTYLKLLQSMLKTEIQIRFTNSTVSQPTDSYIHVQMDAQGQEQLFNNMNIRNKRQYLHQYHCMHQQASIQQPELLMQ
jgi:hypothetical protein